MTMETMSDAAKVGVRARRRVAGRLLPFVFLIYIVNYIDRVNVSFANLRMSTDLGFTDRVYGLGVGVFYVTYVLFEIPGAIIVERWSARKWIARIMISWGIVTILTGFVRTVGEFYMARFFLGLAEASFFPGMIVYLTHWFRLSERSRALLACTPPSPRRHWWVLPLPAGCWVCAGGNWQAGAGFLFSRESGHPVRDRYHLLPDRPSCAGSLATSKRSAIGSLANCMLNSRPRKKSGTSRFSRPFATGEFYG